MSPDESNSISSEESQQDFLDELFDDDPRDDKSLGVFVAVLATVMLISAPFAVLVAYFEGLGSAAAFLLVILLAVFLLIPLRYVAEGLMKFQFWIIRKIEGERY